MSSPYRQVKPAIIAKNSVRKAGPEYHDFIIVGGGAAGVHMAYLLAEDNHDVLLLEARDRLGGRVLSKEIAKEASVELGAQWQAKNGQTLLDSLVERYQFDRLTTNLRERHTFFENKKAHFSYSDLSHLAWYEKLDVVQLGFRIDSGASRVNIRRPWEGNEHLDNIVAADWIRQTAYTKAGFEYWNSVVEQGVCASTQLISILEVFQNIATIGGTRQLAHAEHYYFPAGLQNLLIHHFNQSNVELKLNSALASIDQTRANVVVETSDGQTYEAGNVIIAIPPQVIPTIGFQPPLPAQKRELYSRLLTGQVIKVKAVYSEPWWRELDLNGSIVSTDGLFDITLDVSHSGLGIMAAIVTSQRSSALLDQPEDKLLDAFVDYINEVYGVAKKPISVHCHAWVKDKNSMGGYASRRVLGDWVRYKDAMNEPFDRVHFIGAETSLAWRGYVEGALRSAQRMYFELQEAGKVTPTR